MKRCENPFGCVVLVLFLGLVYVIAKILNHENKRRERKH